MEIEVDHSRKPNGLNLRGMVLSAVGAKDRLAHLQIEVNSYMKAITKLTESLYQAVDSMEHEIELLEIELDALNLETLQRKIR